MNIQTKYSVFCLLVIVLTSCESNTYSEIAAQTEITNPTYQNNIKPIIDATCITCHNNGAGIGGFPLITYEDVKENTALGSLLFRIETATGTASMPLGGPKLSQANINLIKRWAANDFPN